MEHKKYGEYVKILKEELVMAMGCTEPIAVAYGAAVAADALGIQPEEVEVSVSANIIKNVKSVVVPCTGGMRGIKAAVCAGIVSGAPSKELEILSELSEEQKKKVGRLAETLPIQVKESDSGYIFDIQIRVRAGEQSASSRIAGYHTNVICVEKDGQILREKEYTEQKQTYTTDRSILSVKDIIRFADCVHPQ